MADTHPRHAPGSEASTVALAWSLGLLVLLALAGPMLWGVAQARAPLLEDDGEYYAVIARRLAATGVSSFDGRTLTNGYHPLWLWLLTLKTRLIGASPVVTLLIEALCMAGAVTALLRAAKVRSWAWAAIFAAVFAHYVGAMAMLGMEVSLFALTAALFIAVLATPPKPERRAELWAGLRLGMAGAVCVGARIDAAVFVLPALLIAPRSRTARGGAVTIVAAGGLIYGLYNLATFEVVLPISSAVKSLGGLQINHRYLAQLGGEAAHPFGHSRHLLTLILMVATPLVGFLAPRGSVARRLAWAVGTGGALLFAKLAFGSSWRVWPWYDFPLVFVMAALLLILTPKVETTLGVERRWAPAALAVAALLGWAVVARQAVLAARPPSGDAGFHTLNARAAHDFAPVLRGGYVAMGDRAGSFAAAHPGGVFQLEGLVADASWLKRLKAGAGDATPELCARGVRFALAWTPELGAYDIRDLPAMRLALTQFAGPTVRVRRADEVGHLHDPAVYRAAADEPDDHLYLWRLHCRQRPSGGGQAVAPAPP